jgi:hypothetical protein
MFGEQYKSWGFSLYNFLQLPLNFSHLGPNIFFSTLFSNALSFRFCFHVRSKVLHPFNSKTKTIVLYILIFLLLGGKWDDKRLRTER